MLHHARVGRSALSAESGRTFAPLHTCVSQRFFIFGRWCARRVQRDGSWLSRQSRERVIVACMRFGQLNITRWPLRAWDALLLLQLSASRHHHQPCHGARLRSTARATYSDLTSRVYVRHHSPASGSFDRSTLKAAGTVTIFASYYRSCLRAHQRWCKPSSGHGVSFAPHFLQDIALYFVSIYLPFHLSVTLADASGPDLICEPIH